MTRKLITATPDTPINVIALLLEKHAIKRVPILDHEKLVGIGARANLVQELAGLKLATPERPCRKGSRDARGGAGAAAQGSLAPLTLERHRA
jgi:CBS-domain-containing membrane protein